MPRLTKEQYAALKSKGLDDATIQNLAKQKGYDLPDAGVIPVSNPLVNFGAGIGTSIGRAGLGLGEVVTKGVAGLAGLAGQDKAKETINKVAGNIGKVREAVYERPFQDIMKTTAGKLGSFTGEVATLATPARAAGGFTLGAAQKLGAGNKVAKIAQAVGEGVGFTGAQELTGQNQNLNSYALNAGISTIFPVGGMALKAVGETLPSRIINSLIKPLAKDFAYGKNPGRAVAEMGITANNFDDLITGIRTKKAEVGQAIGEGLSQIKNPGQIDLAQTLLPIDEAIANAYKTPRTNASLIQRLEGVKQDIIDNIGDGSMRSAQELKGIVGDLTKWTGNASDDKMVNKALKQVYGSIVSGMDTVLKAKLPPEEFAAYKKATERYGDLISAENAAIYRDKILERQNMLSFGAKNAGLITGLTAAVITGGGAIPAILAGLGGASIDKALATPAFKTRLAALLSKLKPTEVKTFFERVPTATQIFSKEQIDDLLDKTGNYIKNPKLGMSIEDVSKLPKSVNPSSVAKKLSEEDALIIENYLSNPSIESTVAIDPILKGMKIDKADDALQKRFLTDVMDEYGGTANREAFNSPSMGKIDPLLTEAKKYKSAEEFVKAQESLISIPQIKSKYPKLELGIYENADEITLDKIIVPKSERGGGIGTQAMKDLVEYADQSGKRIVLTPSTDYGGSSVSRLTDFYKRFGFVENKGKTRDFSTRESMIYTPKVSDSKSQLTDVWEKANKKK